MVSNYQELALRTKSTVFDLTKVPGFALPILILGEDGTADLLDKVKKSVFYGREMSPRDQYRVEQKMRVTFGDVAEYGFGQRCQENLEKIDPDIIHAIIGLRTEVGEMMASLINVIEHGDDLDIGNLIEELGDLMWYSAILAEALKTTLYLVQAKNIAKLKARYPEKFTTEAAVNRNLEAEAAAIAAE